MTRTCLLILVVVAALSTPRPASSFIDLTDPVTSSAQQIARPDSSWLDRSAEVWNKTMSALPRPSSPAGANAVSARCREFIRQSDSPADRALVRAGWIPYGAVQTHGFTKVITAMSGVDGMCRPLGFQAFVYWEDRYAGTLAPAPMDSRADGSLTTIRLVSPTRILGEFARYAQSDPLCCPTRITYVTYTVKRDEAPIVTPTTVNTRLVGRGEADPVVDNSPGNESPLFGRRWLLTEVGGSAVRSGKAYIELDANSKRFSGDSGCNRVSGGFELTGSNLRFLNPVSTRRACVDTEIQQTETRFLRALGEVDSFQVQNDVLHLYAGIPPILTFRADSAAPGSTQEEARVTGTVTYPQRVALPQDAVIEVKLVDVSRADVQAVTIAEQTITAVGRQVPFEFELRYDPSRIQERRRYVIQARILVGGELRYVNTQAYPVITGGNPKTANVVLRPAGR